MTRLYARRTFTAKESVSAIRIGAGLSGWLLDNSDATVSVPLFDPSTWKSRERAGSRGSTRLSTIVKMNELWFRREFYALDLSDVAISSARLERLLDAVQGEIELAMTNRDSRQVAILVECRGILEFAAGYISNGWDLFWGVGR